MKIEESHIWWMILGIIIGVIAEPFAKGDYRMVILHLVAFTMVIILWRIIIWIMLKIGLIKKPVIGVIK